MNRSRLTLLAATLEMVVFAAWLVSFPTNWKNVVFVGDSFQQGFINSGGAGTVSPNNPGAMTLLGIKPMGQFDGTLHNLGAAGQTIGPVENTLSMMAHGADADALIVPGKFNILVVEGGGNDINTGTIDGSGLLTRVHTYYTSRRAAVTGGAHWDQIIGATIMSGQHNLTSSTGSCYQEALRNGATWANTSATYISPACTCPSTNGSGYQCGINISETGYNNKLKADKGDADFIVDLDAIPEAFNPYNFTYRQADGHLLDNLNALMGAKYAAYINKLNRLAPGYTPKDTH